MIGKKVKQCSSFVRVKQIAVKAALKAKGNI
ncbi:hypothetical protein K151_1174 [Proteus hauseri ZMd44]|nr:hypothetical protein K151_1174 [Proteus hauseri ZMd44]